MAIIDNINYHKIIKYRRDSERLLETMLDNDNETYNIMLQNIVSLFIIDYDNLEKNFFNDKQMDYITNLIMTFIDNENSSLKVTKTELTNIMNLYNTGKIHYNIHKELVLKIATLYNEECNNSLMKINMEILEKICDSFK